MPRGCTIQTPAAGPLSGTNLGCALGRTETLQVTGGEFDPLAVHHSAEMTDRM